MAAVVHLDAHVAVGLYIGDRRRLHPVWQILDRAVLTISPLVALELQPPV